MCPPLARKCKVNKTFFQSRQITSDCQPDATPDQKVPTPFLFQFSGSLTDEPTALKATVSTVFEGGGKPRDDHMICAMESRTSVRCSHVRLGQNSGNAALTECSSCNMLQPISIGTWKPFCMREFSLFWLWKCHGVFDVSLCRFQV